MAPKKKEVEEAELPTEETSEEVAEEAPEAPTPKASTVTESDFSFAVSSLKLNLAKAYVQKLVPTPTGAAYVAAVKERYIITGGLLAENAGSVRRGKSAARTVNMAAHDGTADDD